MICNKSKPHLQTCCGVLEFTAEEGVCFLPTWMMALLQIEDGRRVSLKSVGVQKGNFMKLQPHETDFIQLPNPKAILEREMKHYSVLSQGSSISIQHGGRDYIIDILETKPTEVISCINTDISVDFEEPRDQTGLTELNCFTIIGGMKWYELRKQIFENSLHLEQFIQFLKREHKEVLLNLMKAEFIASTNEIEKLDEPSLAKITSHDSGSGGGFT